MRIRRLVIGCLLALVGPPAAPAELLVSAAASLADVLPQLGRVWEAGGGEKVAFNFAASSTVVSQILAGAPADLVFTADDASMDRLASAGLLRAGSRRNLLSNRLVVVVPVGCSVRIASADDLAASGIDRLALADPTAVPAGKYARSWLSGRGVWERVEPRVIPTLNVRAALAAVAAGEADAGVVYATDAAASPGVEVALVVPEDESPTIVYPAALVASSRRIEEADRLLAFLASPRAQEVFARFGFRAATP
ncbi:MAG: molybdate ABC transporter substrate-binding protein [Thermoanaerobaculia bacterium]